MINSKTYKTGEKAPYSASYNFIKYVDGSATPSPTMNEYYINLTKGEVFPPIRSCNKAAYWQRS